MNATFIFGASQQNIPLFSFEKHCGPDCAASHQFYSWLQWNYPIFTLAEMSESSKTLPVKVHVGTHSIVHV